MNLDNCRVLVTGGARRIGAALCLALAKRGARVAIHCHRSLDEARELAQRCPGAVVVEADLADPPARDALVSIAADALGGLDLLVNNASSYRSIPLTEITDEQWDFDLDLNLKAPFFLARDAGLRMKQSHGGCIVNLTDWATGRPYPAYLPYFAAKAGLAAMTAGLAKALAPEVRVNAVAPGAILPPEGAKSSYEAEIVAATPLRRLGGEASIVSAVLFLAENNFVTGQTVTVDGGRSVR